MTKKAATATRRLTRPHTVMTAYTVSIHFLGRAFRPAVELSIKAHSSCEAHTIAISKTFGQGRRQFGWHPEGGGRGYLTSSCRTDPSAVSIASGLLRIDVTPIDADREPALNNAGAAAWEAADVAAWDAVGDTNEIID